ncbi:hypothetical protein [Xanthocytophaga agilis]|uniref:Uncharacterized protein n=1 Tax=Xanthocytophaga agilis TaxID=3048010 RepID=A0AAE3UG66_9BACT|nr:hypothetical protein [Xanthocytophaga agilis]MDJ1502127.1 hypothetical protein [Xanthocytophaga agilis]
MKEKTITIRVCGLEELYNQTPAFISYIELEAALQEGYKIKHITDVTPKGSLSTLIRYNLEKSFI